MMATGYMRLAAEQAQNTEGTANTVSSNTFDVPVQSVDIDPAPTMLDFSDELRGYAAEPPGGGVSDYAPSGSFQARIRPGYLGLLLALATGGTPTYTAGNGVITDPDSVAVPAGAHRWVFNWATSDLLKTAKALYAPPNGLFYQCSGLGIDTIEFKPDGGAWAADVALKALYWAVISDPSVTPAIETPLPFLEGYCTLSWLSGSATTEDFSFKIENNAVHDRDFSVASAFPSQLISDSPYPKLTGSIPKRAMDATDWAALTAGTTFAATIKLTHSQNITGSYKHQLWIQMPACQYIGGKPDAVTNDRRHKASFDWAARYDTVTSKWATITLVNATAAYETYA